MTILPVIVRELRAQARQRFTFALREVGVLALLAAGFMFAIGHPLAERSGGDLFAWLHRTLFFAIWILVPLSAADCISRERREGTLGLLFLTPLKPTDIVVAKGLAHGLRALTLLAAVLPGMTIPFLLGGISWQQAVLSALVNFSALFWALAAALVASSINRIGLRALVAAAVLAVCAMLVFAVCLGALVTSGQPQFLARRFVADDIWLQGLSIAGVSPRHWLELLTVLPATQVIYGAAQNAVFSLLALAAAVWLAANRIQRNWREEAAPAWVQWSQRVFCTPVVWLSFFRWWMRRKLNRNPIGWLEQRTWTGRLITWSWFAVVISLYSVALMDSNFIPESHSFQVLLGWLLIGSMAVSAAGSFRRERESGVLELLLVAPLTTNQIIGGRVRGLWGQFLPSMALLLGVWLYFASFVNEGDLEGFAFLALGFLTTPLIGLYFSVRCRSFIAAFLLTLICGVLVPLVCEWALKLSLWVYATRGSSIHELRSAAQAGSCAAQLLLASFLGMKLRRRLETRSFPLERAAL